MHLQIFFYCGREVWFKMRLESLFSCLDRVFLCLLFLGLSVEREEELVDWSVTVESESSLVEEHRLI